MKPTAMTFRRFWPAALVAGSLASWPMQAALAQQPPAPPVGDPIGAALEAPAAPVAAPAPPPASTDEEAAETMTTAPLTTTAPVPPVAPTFQPAPPPVVATAPPQANGPYSPFPTAPAAGLTYARPPQAYAPPPSAYVRPGPPTATTPVSIDETNRTPDRPLSVYDMGYDARLRASSASAQGMLGPLDGSWTLNVPGVGDVYVLELVDRGMGPLEGAWRDLRRIGALGASGFVDDIQRFGSTLTVRFSPGERLGPAVATLNAQPDGRWTGELSERGERRTVILRRN